MRVSHAIIPAATFRFYHAQISLDTNCHNTRGQFDAGREQLKSRESGEKRSFRSISHPILCAVPSLPISSRKILPVHSQMEK